MLETLFQSPAQKLVAKYKSQAIEIGKLENTLTNLSDLDLQQKTKEF